MEKLINNLKILDAVLRLYEQNFRNLHWNSYGEDFNDSHKSITTEYYELLSDIIDKVAEMMCMSHCSPANYLEAYELVNSSFSKRILIDSNKLYTRKEIVLLSQKMFEDLANLISNVIESYKNPIDAGIRSEFESILYQITLQYRYINERRI